MLKDRIRIREFFHDFDRLRKGFVGEAGFRSALGTLNLTLTENDVQALLAKYRLATGLVNYSSFCKNIDSVFEASTDPNSVLKSGIGGAPMYSEQEQVAMTQLVQDIKNIVRAHRILLKPSFQDFDPANTQHITLQQFSRVLKQMNLMPPEHVFELLCKRYFDRGNTREVNYVKFCRDVDRPEDMFPGQQLPSSDSAPAAPVSVGGRATKSNFFNSSTKGLEVLENRFSQPTINLANDPTDVEDRIRAMVVMKRIRVTEFFRDFDKLRKGKVTAPQFKSVLATLNIQISDEEYDSLAKKYWTDDDMVNYKAFCASIDEAFTVPGIEKNPTLRVKPVVSSDTDMARKKFLEFDEGERA